METSRCQAPAFQPKLSVLSHYIVDHLRAVALHLQRPTDACIRSSAAMSVHRNFSRGTKYLGGEKFEIRGTGTNEDAENRNGTANSVSVLICFKLVKVILIVS